MHQDAGGAEEAQGEHIRLLFSFGLFAEFSDVFEFCVGGDMSEKYMSQLMRDRKA